METVKVINIDNMMDPVKPAEEQALTEGAMVGDYVPDGAVVALNGSVLDADPNGVFARPDDLIVSMPWVGGSSEDWAQVARFAVATAGFIGGNIVGGFGTGVLFAQIGLKVVNVFFGPEPPKLPDDQGRMYSWRGSGNPVANYGLPRQVIYGKARIKPVAIDNKSYTAGKHSYFIALYGVADHYVEGLADAANEVLLNGSNVATAERGDVVVFSYQGTVDQSVSDDFKQTYVDDPQGEEVTYSTDLTVTSTESTDADGVQIDLVWPHGLFGVNDSGEIKQAECVVAIGYSTDSGSSWTWFSVSDIDAQFTPPPAEATVDAATVDALRFVAKKTQTHRVTVKVSNIDISQGNYQFRIVKATEDVANTQRGSNVMIVEDVSLIIEGGYDYPGLATVGMIGIASELSSGRVDVEVDCDREHVYVYNSDQSMWELRPANNPAWATYDILVNGSSAHPMLDSPVDNLLETNPSFETGDKTGWTATYSGDADTSEVVDTESRHGDFSYHIIEDDNGSHGIMQTIAMSAETQYRVSCWAKCVSQDSDMRIMCFYADDGGSHYPQKVLTANNEWTYYSFSFTTGTGSIGYRKIYLAGRGEAYFDEIQVVEGTDYVPFPSDIRDGSRYGCGINYAKIDYDAFSLWADFCDTNGFTVNQVFDSTTTAWEAAQEIARLGRGVLYLKGSDFSVHYDSSESATQLFTVGNIIEKSMQVSWAPADDLADTIEVTYFDEDAGFRRRTIIVHLAGWDATSDLSPLSVTLRGCTNYTQAYEYGYYLLLSNQYQRRSISFKADVDAIACEIGDVIKVQHDVPQWGYGGRVKSVSVGATYITITLDQEITFTGSDTYYIEYRHSSDDTTESAELQNVASETTDEIEILVADVTTEPSEYDIYALGVENSLYVLYRVLNISRESDQVRRIEAQEYRTEVYGGPQTPDFTLTGADEFVPAFAVRAVESHTLNPQGAPAYVTVAWRYVPNAARGLWEVMFRQVEELDWQGQWENSYDYTIGDAVVQVQSGDAEAYLCIQTHTSGATYDDEPGVGVDWEDFWVQIYSDYTWKGDIDGLWEDDVTYSEDDAVLISSTGYSGGPLAAFVSLGTADAGIIDAPVLPYVSGVLYKPGRGAYIGSVNLDDWKYPEPFTSFSQSLTTAATEVQIEWPFIRDYAYEFTVRAINERGVGQPLEDSPRVRIEISGGTYPEDVDFVAGNCSFDNDVVLEWGRASDPDIVAYEIRDENDNWLSDDSHRFYYGPRLQTSFAYSSYSGTFYVRAVRQGGYVSENADSVSLTNAAPSAPTNLSISARVGSSMITWDAPSDTDVVGYKVYYKLSGGSYSLVADTASEYVVISNDLGSSFYVKIVPYDSFRDGSDLESGAITAKGLSPESGSSLPGDPDPGEFFLHDGVMKYYDGSNWQTITTS